MRPGLAQYDLASILYDPYVTLTDFERAELLAFYKTLPGKPADPTFDNIFYMCAAQRLMQALGAYGFLGMKRDKPEFLTHIPTARKSLAEVVGRVEGLEGVAALLEKLPA
jgi:aminoglycoside/choline kinase family phosphotransferase